MRTRNYWLLASFILAACSHPQPGPDKTAAGAVLGAAWGAGSGAIVGHQIQGSYTGEGAAVGAGLGAAAGAMTGYGYDDVEDSQLKLEKQLAALKASGLATHNDLMAMQSDFDDASVNAALPGGIYQVYFDDDETSLRAGAIAGLEVLGESLKVNPGSVIHVDGHTDDTGNPEYNKRLSEARARTVSAYLASRGVSIDRVKVSSFGSTRPVASNSTPMGRQLNRRVEVYVGK